MKFGFGFGIRFGLGFEFGFEFGFGFGLGLGWVEPSCDMVLSKKARSTRAMRSAPG